MWEKEGLQVGFSVFAKTTMDLSRRMLMRVTLGKID